MTDASEAFNLVRDMQARFNRSTRTHWEHFAAHRARIEELLLPDVSHPAGRLCVLGAGNCNDLDLARLSQRFEEIHLVDLDPAAVAQAVRRQGVEGCPALRIHAPVDLTGIADDLGRLRRPRQRPADSARPPSIDGIIGGAAEAPVRELSGLAGCCDVVLSPCILSQIVGYARDALGRTHPRAADLRAAVRQRHLRLLVDLLSPGGSALLVSDMASARSPEALVGSGDLSNLMNRRVSGGDYFSGLSPSAVRAALGTDARTAPLVADVRFIQPWLWTLGPQKAFLVYALRLRRSAGTILLPPAPAPAATPAGQSLIEL